MHSLPSGAPLLLLRVTGGLAEVHAKLPAVDDLLAERIFGLGGTGDIDEIGMCEASRLTGPSVNGDTYVHDVADIAEKVVEIFVRHLEGHVADEEGLGRRVGLEGSVLGARPRVLLGLVILDDKVAALENLHVKGLDGGLRILEILELNISESKHIISSGSMHRLWCRVYPLLSPLLS